ncbi:DUF421 domain-containing protein [Chryseobacterium sp. JJR-5R]|uniref:DUF421 domain-containing protein n=1 Tax=Chryseobacterium sp. JJR-5R TaxID=3093923 RepID=UPI002A74CEF2|nr:YetF domain-containing protein [Chryseobacterium sp. JJR-5R]WPO81562.1 DUF421 domain-containing protein [Chryseobacterium sp. JJR-5R]
MNLNFEEMFIGDLNFTFAFEIIIRTLIMFSMVLLVLRMAGKKGVRQLSLFEVAIIIALGSAAGDPMFNKDYSILTSVVVFGAIIALYRLITMLASKSEKFERIIEGDPLYVIEDGEFVLVDDISHTFAKDEFFAEMRQASIEHLGQIKTAILETNGNISFYYFPDDEVKYGLPIQPKVYEKKSEQVKAKGIFACTYCGSTEELEPGTSECTRCRQKEWVKAINTTRLT